MFALWVPQNCLLRGAVEIAGLGVKRAIGFRVPLKGSIRLPLRSSFKGSIGFQGLGFRAQCRNLIKKPWAFIKVPYMNPTILGL